jgi:antitoxin component YwqK of YwqJK toxin-antitoxin module
MKKYIIIAMFVVTGVVFAQDKNVKNEVVGDLVKSTFYYENGQIQQEGFYKDGKVHGQWTSYDLNGKKVAIGQYENGMKVGTWSFYAPTQVTHVDYADSRIADVRKVNHGAIVKN